MEMAHQKGEFVRYGTSGVCVIADIESMASTDRHNIRQYYVLCPVADNGTKVFVPLDNPALLAKMHPILPREEIDRAILESAQNPLEWINERNRRSEYFRDILKTGDPRSLMRLCCCIHRRRAQLIAEGKRLAGGDEATLKQAEKLVESEFAFSLNIPRSEVGAYIVAACQGNRH